MNEWVYLGDGLYAQYDGYQIKLRANNPNDNNEETVFVSYETYMSLVKFAERRDIFDLEWSNDE